jgi:predicted metal-dependent peptidase
VNSFIKQQGVALQNLKTKTIDNFNKAIEYIITKIKLIDFSLTVFNEASIQFVGYNFISHKDDNIPLMALIYNRGRFTLLINEKTCAFLSTEEFAFLLLHETLHYIFKHPFLHIIFKQPMAVNIAADLIVNDIIKSIIRESQIEWCDFIKKFEHGYLFGDKLIEKDCSTMAFEDVYNMVTQFPSDMIPDEELNLIKLTHDQQEKLSNISTNDRLQNEMDALDNILNQSNDEDNKNIAHGSGYGNDSSTLLENIKTRFKYNTICKKLLGKTLLRGGDADGKQRKSWQSQPKSRLSLPMSYGIMPAFHRNNGNKHVIYFYLDISGSVTDAQINLFVNLVNNIPSNKYVIKTFVFDISVKEISLENLNELDTGGGTSFDAIVTHVKSQTKEPDNIIIITDGESIIRQETPSPKKWRWIIDNSNTYFSHCQKYLPGQCFHMAKLVP